MKEFANWLTSALDSRRWTETKLAKLSGLNRSRISHIRHNRREPDAEVCIRVAAALRIPTNEVLRRAGFPTVPDVPADLSPEVGEGLRILQGLDGEKRALLIRIARVL